MADAVLKLFLQQAEDGVINEIKEDNVTSTASTRPPSTPEGMAVAYGSLVIMAILPIFFGSYRSVVYHKGKVNLNLNNHTEYFNKSL